ncbi:MAG: hypothetical protein ACTSYA_12760 [Candidatus Kariarchaeaceae archaeon]
MLSNKIILSSIISVLLVSSTLGIILLNQEDGKTEQPIDNINLPPIDQGEQLPINEVELSIVNVSLPQELEKGEKIVALVTLNLINDSEEYAFFTATFKLELSFNEIIINSSKTSPVFVNGSLSKNIIKVAFDPWGVGTSGIYALRQGSYELHKISFAGEKTTTSLNLNQIMEITLNSQTNLIVNPDFESEDENWTISTTNSTAEAKQYNDESVLEITSENNTEVAIELSQVVNWTSVTLFEVELLANITSDDSFLSLWAGETEIWSIDLSTIPHDSFEKLSTFSPVGIINQRELKLKINSSSQIHLIIKEVWFMKQYHPVNVIIADDNWTDIGYGAAEAATSVLQASYYFELFLGIKLIPLTTLVWDREIETIDLHELRDDASQQIASQMGLDDGVWHVSPGRNELNHGFDLLLAMTSHPGEHYGVVSWNSNWVIMCGRSEFSGTDLRTSWADNLVQHEVSHIFNAPDHYSGEDAPSVMTKATTVPQVIQEILSGTLWAQLNNWLLEDLFEMTQFSSLFDL